MDSKAVNASQVSDSRCSNTTQLKVEDKNGQLKFTAEIAARNVNNTQDLI